MPVSASVTGLLPVQAHLGMSQHGDDTTALRPEGVTLANRKGQATGDISVVEEAGHDDGSHGGATDTLRTRGGDDT